MNRLLLCSTVLALTTSAALAAAGPRRSTRHEFSELRAAPSVTAIPASGRTRHDVGRCMGTGCRGGHLPVGK